MQWEHFPTEESQGDSVESQSYLGLSQGQPQNQRQLPQAPAETVGQRRVA